MEREWKAYVDEYTSSEILLPNCIAAAAFLTYCGAMGVDRRFVETGFNLFFYAGKCFINLHTIQYLQY